MSLSELLTEVDDREDSIKLAIDSDSLLTLMAL
jgi:hypothetical protein